MVIEKKPFVAMELGEEQGGSKKQDIVPVYFSESDRESIERWKRFIHQPKDSTAIKTALEISLKLLDESIVPHLLGIVLKNKAKNKRTGWAEYE